MSTDPESETLPPQDMPSFVSTLKSSKHIIAIAGAGLSAASGIPTFRGTGGLWRKYDAVGLATPEAFKANPSRVWQFYHYRREKALAAQPNQGHLALAMFSIPSLREKIVPGASFTLVTQNVDGLSRRALDQIAEMHPELEEEIRSPVVQDSMLEMHGRLFDVVCTSSTCGHKEHNLDSPICPALAGTENVFAQDAPEPDIDVADLPKCKKCGSLARPGVVWFGEMPWYLTEIGEHVKKADLCIVVGTSSTVYPAAGFASKVRAHGGDQRADFLFLGPSESTLPKALGLQDNRG
ncbi:DHS-like NAD/FAD-binding domain-containing protein [Lentinus tigrinus ALCF2SS1-7]|uniref:NAD-dependent protein deacylase n=1 Tax=Lentinus tigrinus ALCF2SS1-6 TaxID=1328759 RepID=A0A5C2SDP5_9APHY|nr:DHS-like NAD/FAD-binding domain-containing protein [Lentinus tigrinus ALCF2SS1-6]RPD74386.1 DHS-like NAD/FAD-binding domain-containing protein [Lentinus tigrinus ALCF2SS1-7]